MLNTNEENKLELWRRNGELAARIAIIGKNTDVGLKEEKKEIEARKKALKSKITNARKRMKESSQEEFIIGASQLPEKVESVKDRFASRFSRD